MLYIFLLILLIIILLILTKKKEHLKNIDKYNNYQLADIIRGMLYYRKREIYNSYPTKYSDTLATKYINEVKNLPKNKQWNNMEVLDKLTKRSNKLDVALHLRMGDVIGKYDKKTNMFKDSVEPLFRRPSQAPSSTYFHQPFIYEKLFKQLKQQQNIKEIHLFYGAHTVWNEDNDKYLEIIKKIINSNGFKIIDNSNGNPDSDFINMSNSKIFIRSGQGGGFSNTISNLVKYRNNKVIDPSDYK